MPRTIRCITFDCYGTLIDWEQGIRSALLDLPVLKDRPAVVGDIVSRRELIERGLLVSAPDLPDVETPEERYESLAYRPYRDILAESLVLAAGEVGISLDPEDARRAAATMPRWRPFPDTRGALAKLGSRFPLGILSNVEEEVIAQSIEAIGIPFDLVVTAERVESYKPAPDHWYAAMHELEADEQEILHLAASPFHDLETATLLGIPCGYINRSGHPLPPDAKPLFTVRDLESAVPRLDRFTSPSPPRGPGRRGPAATKSGPRSL